GVPNVYGLIGAEANAIAPGKRPLSSMSPTFVQGERGVAILGTPGGSRIITMVLLGVLGYAEGGDAASLVQRGRFHHQYLPDVIQAEAGALDEAVRTELTLLGHTVEVLERPYGNMQVVIWEREAGRVEAASDPRGVGSAEVR
ncbi:MAG: gamma-glutamyltransferase, partial [Gammaproteobacteria bacterium]|nr:gamma-glutamyltransferase [Gammaproteobacteria bacterium]NIR99366.1 gamma-glutamyltransferase [Gammaproteobacteria bacterium]NIT64891.1 gamma-glutamyltransferase [Gammaproteobacteria bacterium]NIV21845.1 gamma-glutamyltransferase [Gammaproteobacteria bacterium]NIY33471.1 gamma-glutamyltransferase [Gammaproteobacteria bacterium]